MEERQAVIPDEELVRYLLEVGLASSAQLDKAKQASAQQKQPISDILIQQGVFTATQRESLLQKVLAQRTGGVQQLGPYKLIKKLGEGGMGVVYLGEDTLTGRKAALKVITQKPGQGPEALSRFRREARAAGKLNHPNIIAAYGADEDQGRHYFAMEFCEGEPLDEVLKREQFLPWHRALSLTQQVAEGLKHAHDNGIIHRDIKPANIFLTQGGVAKILDLGLSKIVSDQQNSFMTQTGMAMGTPHYISPEQARGDKDITGSTDIYSLGATLYHLCTGRPPFAGDSVGSIIAKHMVESVPDPRDIRPEIPEELVLILSRMMGKFPVHRHANCDELLNDLNLVLGGKPPSSQALDPSLSTLMMRASGDRTMPVPGTRKTNGPAAAQEKKQPPYLIIGAGALVCLLLIAALFGMSRRNTQSASNTDQSTTQPNTQGVGKTPPDILPTPPQILPTPPVPIPVPPPIKPPDPAPAELTVDAPERWKKALNLISLWSTEDAVTGQWNLEEGELFSPRISFGYSELPYSPPEEYDFRIDFTTVESVPDVNQIISVNRQAAHWMPGGRANQIFGFAMVDGNFDRNPSSHPGSITPNERHVSIVQVRKDGLKGYIDGNLVSELKRTEFKNLGTLAPLRMRDTTLLGIVSHQCVTRFHKIQVLEISGKGQFTRPNTPEARKLEAQRK